MSATRHAQGVVREGGIRSNNRLLTGRSYIEYSVQLEMISLRRDRKKERSVHVYAVKEFKYF